MKIALFGSGWIMNVHATGVVAHPEGELVAVANWREESAHALAERFDISRVTTDWRQLALDPDIDAVIVGTPNALHAPQTIACLNAGKHVLVEKPMALNAAEADQMLEAARAGGGFLMVAHCWRFHQDVIAVRDRIASGELGDIVKTRGYGVHAGWGPRAGSPIPRSRAVERSSTWACMRSTLRGSFWAIRLRNVSAPP